MSHVNSDPGLVDRTQRQLLQPIGTCSVQAARPSKLHMQNLRILGTGGCHQIGVWVQVGGVLAELQAEQARLRQLCSQQAAAMQDLQRQAQQAAK